MTTGMSMKWEGIEKVTAKLTAAASAMPTLTGQAMYTAAIRVLKPAVQQRLRDNRSVFRGQLMQRVSARVVVAVGGSVTIELGSLGVPYGLDVEQGAPARKVGSSEAKAILEYARKKMGYEGDKAHAVAAAIIETIETTGTKPHPYLEPAWEASKDAWLKDTLARIKAKAPLF